ncbi:MAG: hypothetical protein ABW106_14765 [Steroidobacteraceae bacterium]
MDAYIVGNLVGRLVLSYFLVWLAMLACVRDWRVAFARSRRSYGLGCVLILSCIGLATID